MTQLPRNWRWGKLSDIAASTKNAIVDGPFGSNLKLSDYVEKGVPVLQGKNITNDSFKWFDVRFITDRKAEELKRSSVRVGDILIVKIGSIGYSAIIDNLNGHQYAIIPANLAKLTIDPNIVNIRYVQRWLTSTHAKRYLIKNASKTAQPALSLTKLKNLPIPVPPLDEQRRIAEVLDKADALRQKRRLALQKLDTLLQSVFLEMFGDPLFNPKGFTVVKFSDICSKIFKGAFDLTQSLYIDEGVPFLRITNIQNKSIDLKGCVYISESTHRKFIGSQLRTGDIIFSKVGTIDRIGLIPPSIPYCNISQNNVGAILKKEIVEPAFVLAYLTLPSTLNKIRAGSKKAVQDKLVLNDLRNLPFLLPEVELQKRFLAIVDKLTSTKETAENSCKKIDGLFDSLQHRAFKGELFETSMPSVGSEP